MFGRGEGGCHVLRTSRLIIFADSRKRRETGGIRFDDLSIFSGTAAREHAEIKAGRERNPQVS